MITMTNGMLHISILYLSLVFVVIIVQHAVFLWHISFCLRGGTVMIRNGIYDGEDLVNRRKIGGKMGVDSGHKKSRRGESSRWHRRMRDESSCFEKGDIMMENRECRDLIGLKCESKKVKASKQQAESVGNTNSVSKVVLESICTIFRFL